MYIFKSIRGFDYGEAHIHMEMFWGKHIYKLEFCWKGCLISLISLILFLLSINEVLLDDLGLIVMFWLSIDYLKNDEDTSCMWLKISNGFVFILEWCSGFVYGSMFISEWQWFNFKVQCFEIHTRVSFKEVTYTRGFSKIM